jgi:hypothetical protein
MLFQYYIKIEDSIDIYLKKNLQFNQKKILNTKIRIED